MLLAALALFALAALVYGCSSEPHVEDAAHPGWQDREQLRIAVGPQR